MTADKCRAKAQELEAQAHPPMQADARAAFMAQARYLREHADRLEDELRQLADEGRLAA